MCERKKSITLVIYLALKIGGKTSLTELGSLLFNDPGAEADVREEHRRASPGDRFRV